MKEPKLPQVILIGDSIRQGYKGVVARELDGAALVWSPDDNCRWCQYTLDHLDEWVISRQPDLVHLNNGLHDMMLQEPGNRPRCTVEEYAAALERLFSRILRETRAKLIFATTTPVMQERQRTSGYQRIVRYDSDPPRYNAAAVQLAARFHVPVNDLFAVVTKAGKDKLLSGDGVHFTPDGYEVLGRAVAEAIRAHL